MDGFKQSAFGTSCLPVVLEPEQTNPSPLHLFELIKKERSAIHSHLLTEGAVLFRGFPLETPDDFQDAIDHLQLGAPMNYVGGDSPRDKIKGAVYTSTEAPASFKIPLHNELSYVKNYPKHILFFCQAAPEKDGETILGDAREVFKAIRPEVKEKFIEKGLRYTSCYYNKSALMELLNRFQRSHKSWPEVLEAKTKEDAEKKCLENDFKFKWNKDDWIQIEQERPATLKHPITGEEVWFNQAHLYDFNPKFLGLFNYIVLKALYILPHMRLHEVCFATGEPIPRDDLYHILDVLDAKTVKFPWKKGDLLVLDNILAMHGRAPFKGKRRILAAMTG